MGGRDRFVDNLNATFAEPLGKSKFEFYAQLPDHTGNVGQFSMANEPAFHIPYLYNYAGCPWMTQRRIRQLLRTWYRNDLMGIPGDEDGGGMSAFVVFSSLGLYPVTPGIAAYNIGSPLFAHATLRLASGATFTIKARNVSADNKYIQRATLNGSEWHKPWLSHAAVMAGGVLTLEMGSTPNKEWGSSPADTPPSAASADE
jgi:predicted alpha-1,2-mannosidase